MNLRSLRNRLLAICSIGFILLSISGPLACAAEFGRLLGTVSDSQGNPLMGAAVSIVGPSVGLHSARQIVERVITDPHGRFAIERLVPGSYSLRISSPARVPVLRNGVSVKAGRTTEQLFVLSDIFRPVRFQIPPGNASTWGEDWKWVLRTCATTRPILRFNETRRPTAQAKAVKHDLPSQRLIGLMPGGTRREALADDRGLGSVLAYLRPLSQDSDLLLAGSMTPYGLQASSLATAFRKNLANGDPQLLAVAVHQLSFSEGFPLPSDGAGRLSHARGVALTYSQTRRLSPSLSLTAGFEIDYLNAVREAIAARPSVNLEYQANAMTLIGFRLGAVRPDGGTLLERVGVLNAFPRVSLRDHRPRLETLNHGEISIHRKLSKISRLEIAAYRDSLQNPAVLGFGDAATLDELAGNFLPNPVSGGVTLNATNYNSSGFGAVYSRAFGSHLQTSLAYAMGSALTLDPGIKGSADPKRSLSGAFRPEGTQSFAGKVSARIPVSQTQIVTSYEWLQPGRVTNVDPFGQAALQMQPYLGIFIRQPLPSLAFLPAHIEALADFRNLLDQGYVPISRRGEKSLLLTPVYRSFRGGFSVQF